MAMVRNSVGSNAYVSDEIITARSGMRLRVGNTDAEVSNTFAEEELACSCKELNLN